MNSIDTYYTDEEFFAALALFNGFFGTFRWQDTMARTDHVDEFGDAVVSGEVYFTRKLGVAERLKLSRRSMSTLLRVFFDTNSGADRLGRVLVEEAHQKLVRAVDAVDARLDAGRQKSTSAG